MSAAPMQPESNIEATLRSTLESIKRQIERTGHLGADYRHHLEMAAGHLPLAIERLDQARYVRRVLEERGR